MQFEPLEFAHRLLEIRKELHFSQEEMAARLNVVRMTYTNYEAGKRTPDIAFLGALHELTGYSYDYLMGAVEAKKPENADWTAASGLNDAMIYIIKTYAQSLNRLSGPELEESLETAIADMSAVVDGKIYIHVSKSYDDMDEAIQTLDELRVAIADEIWDYFRECWTAGYHALNAENRATFDQWLEEAIKFMKTRRDEYMQMRAAARLSSQESMTHGRYVDLSYFADMVQKYRAKEGKRAASKRNADITENK